MTRYEVVFALPFGNRLVLQLEHDDTIRTIKQFELDIAHLEEKLEATLIHTLKKEPTT